MIDFDFDGMFEAGRTPRPPQGTSDDASGYHALLRDLRSADVALATVQDAVIQTDHRDLIVRANRAAERMAGATVQALVGKTLAQAIDLTEPDWDKQTVPVEGPRPDGVFRVLRTGSGQERLVLVSLSTHAHGRIYVIRDTTLAAGVSPGFDALTGLPDRQQLEGALRTLLARPDRDAWQLLYLDLDQFKVVNELCGHRAGDELLQALTRRWAGELLPEEMLARLGGDEFCVLLSREGLDGAREVGDRLIDIAQALRFDWKGQVFRIGASGGLVSLAAAENVEMLLAAVDSACWAAKENGRNRLHTFDAGNRELRQRQEQMGWLTRLGHAIDEDRLRLDYQHIAPITAQGDTGHAEILVRMVGEDGTIIAPGEFIPAAERFNLMPRLDRWVVEQVCLGIARRKAKHPTRPVGRWAINLSGTTFTDPRFTDWVRERLIEHDIPAGAIGFELTETAAISQIDRAREFISAVRDLGCTISLDDFGSGFSSFAYLKTLQVDYLKIDGSFVRNIAEDHVDRAMVEAIHRVGNIMGIPTIAEFIESPGLVDILRSIGVSYGQGCGIHAPQPWPWFLPPGVDRSGR